MNEGAPAPTPSLSVLRAGARLLSFRLSRDELLALDRRHLAFGFVMTWPGFATVSTLSRPKAFSTEALVQALEKKPQAEGMAGEVETGAVTIVQALNAYGEHFEHPGWQMID